MASLVSIQRTLTQEVLPSYSILGQAPYPMLLSPLSLIDQCPLVVRHAGMVNCAVQWLPL